MADTDTIGSVTGAVAGARFGRDVVPDRWVETLSERAALEALAAEIFEREYTTLSGEWFN